jgi:hypothetical protein
MDEITALNAKSTASILKKKLLKTIEILNVFEENSSSIPETDQGIHK